MDRRQLLFGMTALALGSSTLSSLLNAQISETAGWLTETSSSRASDHERAGLSRGLIKTSVEEITFAGTTAADGTQTPEQKSWSTTEYDVEGRIMATRARDSDGSEWVTRNTYDASGHLLKAAWGKQGEPTSETVYSYDDQGRVLSITYSSTPDNPVTFRYDERGRKTKVQVSRPEDYLPNAAFSGSPFQIADAPPNLPGGGSATTVYDEHDRPTEVQVRDAQGELVSRAVRIYDTQGRVTEEKEILDNPEMLFPADVRAKMLEGTGLSREQLREHLHEQFTKLMGGEAAPLSVAYSYDAHGRIKQRRWRIYDRVDTTETTYNEHGDIVEERTTSAKSIPAGVNT